MTSTTHEQHHQLSGILGAWAIESLYSKPTRTEEKRKEYLF